MADNFATMLATLVPATLMEAVDRDRERPAPAVGESVTNYWLRVLRFHAWEDGREAGLRDYDDRMPDYTPNPFEGA